MSDEAEKKLDAYVEGLVQSVLEVPRLKDLDTKSRKKAAETVRSKLDELVLETLFNRLSEAQIEDIRSSIGKSDLEEKIENYASLIPGLAGDLENRLEREAIFIRNSMS